METLLAQPQTHTDAPHGTQALSPVLSDFAMGFAAYMRGEDWETAKTKGDMHRRGWWSALDAQAEAMMPAKKERN